MRNSVYLYSKFKNNHIIGHKIMRNRGESRMYEDDMAELDAYLWDIWIEDCKTKNVKKEK